MKKKFLSVVISVMLLLSLALGAGCAESVVGKTYSFVSYDVWFADSATEEQKHTVVDMMTLMFPDVTVDETNCLEKYKEYYVSEIASSSEKCNVVFVDEQTVIYNGVEYDYEQNGADVKILNRESGVYITFYVSGNDLIYESKAPAVFDGTMQKTVYTLTK